jgi:protein-disulfide isomerase
MPSGRKSRQQRRATPPPVRSKGMPRSRQASPRAIAIAGGVAAVAVLGIVLAVVLTGGKGSDSVGTLPTTGSLANALPGAGDVHALLDGIPQSGLTLGSSAAPATLVEYVDLQCPYCRTFETEVMPELVRRYVRDGRLKVEARPLAFIGADSVRGRNALLAAARQDAAFDFAQILYDNQATENTGWLDDRMVARVAESIPGLNPRRLFAVRDDASIRQQAAELDADASAAHVDSTPTVLVGRSAGTARPVPLASPDDLHSVVAAIDAALGSS